MATDPATIARWTEANRAEWNDAHMVTWWSAWNAQWSDMTLATTPLLAECARVAPGQRVLDLASGSGEPAITLARLVGPGGRVTATDVSAGLLASAEANAGRAGVANLGVREAAAEDLPFSDQEFDRVTCRFGIMYFPDVAGALAEARRVLGPGGRAAFLVWGPPETNSYDGIYRAIARHLELPEPEAGAPATNRFSDGASLAGAMRVAGFVGVEVITRTAALPWPGTLAELDAYLADSLRPVLDQLSAEPRRALLADLQRESRAMARDGRVEGSAAVVVVAGDVPR